MMPYFEKLLKTFLLLITLFSLGIGVSVTGPTLMDLADVMDCDLSSSSFVFTSKYFIGSIIGAFIAGFLINRYYKHRFGILCFFNLIFGISAIITPYSYNLIGLLICTGVCGLAMSVMFTGCNTICIDLWRNHEGGGGKYLQSIHFGFALGGIIGPIIAKPFLSIRQRPEISNLSIPYELPAMSQNIDEEEVSIYHLFPILGSFSCLLSIGYLVYEIMERHASEESTNEIDKTIHNDCVCTLNKTMQQTNMRSTLSLPENRGKQLENEQTVKRHSIHSWIFLGIMLTFFIGYVGVEASLSSLLSAFSVNSKLQLSQQEGTIITSYFWLAFATTRLLYIFVPNRVSSFQGICLSLSIINVGCILLCIYSDTSKTCLSVFSAVVGSALGPLFGNFIMWLEKYLIVDVKVNALITIFGSIGGSLIPTLVGQLIKEMPMFLMYLIMGLSIGLILLLGASYLLGRKIKDIK